MNMWCHLPTGYIRRFVLQFVALVLIFVALFTTLILAPVSSAVASTNRTISFQGRLLTSGGAVVADGNYNIQFKIYQDGSGTAVGNPGGSLKWTESYVNNGGNGGVEVRSGYFSVSLGSLTQFGSSVDWDQDTLWLSMNVAGSAAGCSTFGTGACPADGEMLPMKQITASPYALNAGAVGGKTADNFIQLAQGVQTDASLNTSSIFVNKTGTGNLLQLQNTGSDIFTVTNSGDLELGSGGTRALSIGNADDGTNGDSLVVHAGYGGNGAGNRGGNLFLQGGGAGGTNADGGDIAITGGVGTGTGKDGSIYIGASDTDAVQIGSTNLASGTQTINIGNNNVAGGTTNVTIGSGGSATGGTTAIQGKNSVTISTNGTTRATFSDTTDAVYFGNGVSASAPNDFTVQGTNSSAATVAGGSLTVQGGNATTGNTNGGNVVLSGGTGSGTGANGLVVLNTPTFATVTNDANCYTGGSSVASSCTITKTSVDNSSAIIVGFSATGQSATLPNPTLSTAGRVIYVTAANASQPFTLRANVGAGNGIEQAISILQNTTVTLFWNGSNWTLAGGSGATTLQDTYDKTQQITGSADILTYNDGLTVRNGNTTTANNTLLDVQSADLSKLFSVNSGTNNYSLNSGAESAGTTSSTFPDETWGVAGVSTVSRYTTKGNNIESGNASVRVSSGEPYSGGFNKLSTALTPSTTYSVSMSARLESGTFNNFAVLYSHDGSNISATCQDNITLTTTAWTKITCTFQTPASGITSGNNIAFGQVQSGTYAYFIDNVTITEGTTLNGGGSASPNVQIGAGTGSDATTLFTLDKSGAPPSAANDEALLGSMYYDTTLGKVQCFEAEGWGACGSSPDTFVTLSPEYANAVMHGSGTGTMSSDLCSDMLNINDGSSSQPTICGTNETNNFYKWTSPSATAQTRAIFVTYQLPDNFKAFANGSTNLMARTDSTDSTVDYQVYRNNASGLTACGSTVSVSTGTKTTWQKAATTGSADPSTCDFAAGDSIVIRINLTASNDANAYVGNLNFTFNNQ